MVSKFLDSMARFINASKGVPAGNLAVTFLGVTAVLLAGILGAVVVTVIRLL